MTCPHCNRTLFKIQGHMSCLYCGYAEQDKNEEKKDNSKKIKENEEIVTRAEEALRNNIGGSKDYCHNRGLDDNIIEKWQLGYVGEGEKRLGISWSERLLFPIQNENREIVGFGGRIINQSDRPKYLNSRNSDLYNKSKTLYGMQFLVKGCTVHLCEGYADVITMDSYAYSCPVASCGTSLTIEQAYVLKDVANRVVICYDSDDAGRTAVLRASEILMNSGFSPLQLFVITPRGAKDVDEALRNNKELVKEPLPNYLYRIGETGRFISACLRVGNSTEKGKREEDGEYNKRNAAQA